MSNATMNADVLTAARGLAEAAGRFLDAMVKAGLASGERPGPRRGRPPGDENKAKRAMMLAILRDHPTMADDVRRLAAEVGVSRSTIYNWLERERRAYLASAAVHAARDDDDD